MEILDKSGMIKHTFEVCRRNQLTKSPVLGEVGTLGLRQGFPAVSRSSRVRAVLDAGMSIPPPLVFRSLKGHENGL